MKGLLERLVQMVKGWPLWAVAAVAAAVLLIVLLVVFVPGDATGTTPTPTPTATSMGTPTPSPTATGVGYPTVTPTYTVMPTATPTETQEPEPTPTEQPVAIYFDQSPYNVERETDFTVFVNMSRAWGFWGAQFDVQYNPSIILFKDIEKGVIWEDGSGNRTEASGLDSNLLGTGPDGQGLLRVVVHWDDYQREHSFCGINGSGHLCAVTFHATSNTGTSNLAFVEGLGEPKGELILVRMWQGDISEIPLTIEIEEAKVE